MVGGDISLYELSHGNSISNQDNTPDLNRSKFSVERIQNAISSCYAKHEDALKVVIIVLGIAVYFIYFGYCLSLGIHNEDDARLIWVTALAVLVIIWKSVKNQFNDPVGRHIFKPISRVSRKYWKYIKW